MPSADNGAGGQGELDPFDVFPSNRLADAQAFLRVAALGDVAEEDRNLPIGRVTDTDGAYVEPAFEGVGVVLEVGRLAGLGDVAVGLEPEFLQVGRKLGDPLAPQVDPGLTLERRVGFNEAVIDGVVVGVEFDFDDGEGGFDGFQNGAEALFTFAQCGFGTARTGQVEHGPDHAFGFAVGIADQMPAVEHLGVGSVLTAEAVLGTPGGACARHRRPNRSLYPRAILLVDLRKAPVTRRFDGAGGIAVRLFQRVVPDNLMGSQIPVPDGVAGRFDGQAQARDLGLKLLASKLFQDIHPSCLDYWSAFNRRVSSEHPGCFVSFVSH
ncbi:hypothetical protein D3C81_1023800 [compost metagenome]